MSAEEARRISGETIPFDQMSGHENRVGYYYNFPIGIVAAITPFNDPLNLVAHKVGPAIASGNAIIVKPATLRSEEHTSELQSRGHLVCRLLLEKKNKDDKASREELSSIS